jgi:hypothetical protein
MLHQPGSEEQVSYGTRYSTVRAIKRATGIHQWAARIGSLLNAGEAGGPAAEAAPPPLEHTSLQAHVLTLIL